MAATRVHPTHREYIIAGLDMYAEAIVERGYSVQDILNQITSVRRGTGTIFDLTKKRV